MYYDLFDYLDAHGNNLIKLWIRGQQKQQRAKVNAKIKLLGQHGETLLASGLMTPAVGSSHIRELVIRGNVALRLLLCRGPINMAAEREDPENEEEEEQVEYTFLYGAEERDGQYVPADAVSRAEDRRQIILHDHSRRREHEHTGP